jgi:hypothetical protein
MSLTFDRFRQDQVLQLLHQEEGSFATTGLSINDRPDGTNYSVADMKRDFGKKSKRYHPTNSRLVVQLFRPTASWEALAFFGDDARPGLSADAQ